jgi:hypothetical protein
MRSGVVHTKGYRLECRHFSSTCPENPARSWPNRVQCRKNTRSRWLQRRAVCRQIVVVNRTPGHISCEGRSSAKCCSDGQRQHRAVESSPSTHEQLRHCPELLRTGASEDSFWLIVGNTRRSSAAGGRRRGKPAAAAPIESPKQFSRAASPTSQKSGYTNRERMSLCNATAVV